MSAAALASFLIYAVIGFGLRSWVQWRRTGDTGFRGVSGRPRGPEWWAGALFALAMVAGLMGPLTALIGFAPIGPLTIPALQTTGLALAIVGTLATVLTQLEMGANWRIGVDVEERTELVTSGPFTWVRNPIFFTLMAVTVTGLALI